MFSNNESFVFRLYPTYNIMHRQLSMQAVRMVAKRKIIRRCIRHRAAATTLQRRWRGVAGRVKAARQLVFVKVLNVAAVRMQCAYRQRLARRRVILTRKIKVSHLENIYFK